MVNKMVAIFITILLFGGGVIFTPDATPSNAQADLTSTPTPVPTETLAELSSPTPAETSTPTETPTPTPEASATPEMSVTDTLTPLPDGVLPFPTAAPEGQTSITDDAQPALTPLQPANGSQHALGTVTVVWVGHPAASHYDLKLLEQGVPFYLERFYPNEVCDALICAIDLSAWSQILPLTPGFTYTWRIDSYWEGQDRSGVDASFSIAPYAPVPDEGNALRSVGSSIPNADGKIAYSSLGLISIITPDYSSNITVNILAGCAYQVGAPCYSTSLAISPDQSKIAFVARRMIAGYPTPTPSQYDIYLMNIDGTGGQWLTNTVETENWLSWSPDGTRLAYTRYFMDYWNHHNSIYKLHLYTLATGQEIVLMNDVNVMDPSWTPDGSQIIFTANCAIWSAHSTTGVIMPVAAKPDHDPNTPCSQYFHGLKRSPVANQYVYYAVSYLDATKRGLRLLTIGSTGQQTFTTLTSGFHENPDWSPDGTRVVYDHHANPESGGFGPGEASLRIYGLLSGQSTLISPYIGLSSSSGTYHADWGGTWAGCPAGAQLRGDVCQVPTAVVLPTPVPITECTAIVVNAVNIRSGPGEGFSLIGSISNGITVNILGRTQNGSWLRVQKREDGIVGFSVASALTLQGNCNNLPVFSDTGLPLPTSSPTLTSTPTRTPDPNISPTPTPTPATRLVETQAVSFHANAARFGLPQPFNLWPVVEEDDFQNGYGPNWFSQSRDIRCDLTAIPTPSATAGPDTPTPTPDPCPYRGVNNIHPGLDYHTFPPEIGSIVVALCDGVIVPGRREPSGQSNPYGGSAAGWGLTLRCFADDPNDTDNDGLRNLSNIIVVYNHLRIDQEVGNEQHPSDGAYQIVYAGQALATTAASGTDDIHLDLQLYIADGHRSQNAVQLNPRFMNPVYLRVDIAGTPRPENEQQPYPAPYNNWSLQGRLEGSGRGRAYNFWTQPLAEPFLYDVTGHLNSRYPLGTRYIGPNCANLPSTVDINQSWWNSPNRVVECIVPTGLGDVQ
jgi:uncharacterized protein YraI